jgi:predicted small metal-binding protein
MIAGEEEEVVRAAVQHAVSWHGDEDTPELRMMIRASLVDEMPRYESEYESVATD